MKLSPAFLTHKLEHRPVLKKIIANTGWLTVEKIFRMGLVLLVNVLLARYLGPAKFGILNYAISLVGFLGAFVYLGLSGLVIRDIVHKPEQKYTVIGTTFALKMTGGLLAYLTVLLVAYLGHAGHKEFWVLFCMGFALFFKPFETIDYWFHSQTKSKFSVYAKGLSAVITALFNVALVMAAAPLLLFAVAHAMELAVTAVFLILFYIGNHQNPRAWQVRLQKARELIGQSWILILSGFFSMVYLKIDQIMLRWMIGPSEVGVYSVAVNFSEVWYFLPTALALSVYPTLIQDRHKKPEAYKNKLQQTFNALFLLSLCVAILVTLFAKPVIFFLYGQAYAKSGAILMIHIWAGVFIFMRALFSRIILIENLLYFSLLTHMAGAGANVILNLLLIKPYAGYGAAWATLLSYATASYIALFFYSQTRPYAAMMSRSILFPIHFMIKRCRAATGSERN